MSIKISVGHNPSLHSNVVIRDGSQGLIYASCFGYSTDSKTFVTAVNKKDTIYCGGRYYETNRDRYDIESSKVPDSDFTHTIITRKDNRFDSNGVDTLMLFCFFETDGERPFNLETAIQNDEPFPESMKEAVYDKLDRYYPWPALKNWIPYIVTQLADGYYIHSAITQTMDDMPINGKWLNCLVINTTVNYLTELISTGLKNCIITMGGSNEVSEAMRGVTGLDSYLDATNEVHARRIQEMFHPYFTPGEDEYSQSLSDVSDYQEYMAHLKLYPAQKTVIQGVANALRHDKDFMFFVVECGGGKTCLGLTTVMTAHGDKARRMTNVVMCPGHLVYMWQREIERLCPMSEAVVVENFAQFKALEPKIKDHTMRHKHLWLVMSKERAKFDFEERPAAVWSKSKNCFVCPSCGQPLYTVSYEGKGRYRREIQHRMGREAFRKQKRAAYEQNLTCRNTVKVYNQETGEHEWVPCGAKLWTANVNNSETPKWVKLGKGCGWVMAEHITQPTCCEASLLDEYTSKSNPTVAESNMLEALADAADGNLPPQVAPRRYSIAKYIRQYLKGEIDYFIADEVHELKGESLQGEAFGDFVRAAKKSIGLTGTLLNGYAKSLFYLLYRTCPSLMKAEGFDYDSEGQFTAEYGVSKSVSTYANENGRLGERHGRPKVDALPGISPLVFTKFLLENCAFLSLEDISEGLPGYREVPVPCEMDDEMKQGYMEITQAFKSTCGGHSGKGIKTMSQMVNLLSVYPDQPWGQFPVIHPETGETIVEPRNCNDTTVRSKEQALIDLCQRKKEAGEKVLVYYHFVNRTKLDKRLKDLLADNGISAAVMGSSVKSEDREAWIAKQVNDGVDVVICNPKLVETGLNLLDFTTICFYEMDYNLYTLRQASRRSWRLNQEHDIEVYFLYYRETVQETCLSLMANKLKAAMAIEGKFSEEGMAALANNDDILTQIASSVTNDIKETVDVKGFEKLSKRNRQDNERRAAETHLIDAPRKRFVAEYVPEVEVSKRKLNKVVQKCIIGETEKRIINNPFKLLQFVG